MTQPNTHIAKVSNFSTSLFLPLKNADVPFEKLIEKHTLKKFDLKDPEKHVPMALMYDFIHIVDRYIGSPGIVSILSDDFNIQDLGDYGDQILSNPNLLHFIQEAIKYESELVSSLRMKLQVFGARTRFSFLFIDPPAPGKEFVDAINISQILEGFRIFGGPNWVPIELQMQGGPIKSFEHILPPGDYRITYGFPDFAFIFPTEMLSWKNPFQTEQNKPIEFNVHGEQLSHQIEKLLYNYQPGQIPSLLDFRDYFYISPRSIRRQLLSEGTTFSEIRERTLFLKAVELVSTTNWKVKEIAEYLGYTEAANFIRFFKRYTGKSPSKFRDNPTLASNDNSLKIVEQYI